MLVDYSDSEEDEAEGASAAPSTALPPPAPAPRPPPPAPTGPPAKKQKKEINLQSLLSKNDAALPFEAAGQLPADFFDSARVREPDAGEDQSQQDEPPARGWAALSSMLPAPKNVPKAGASRVDPSALFRNAKPLKRPGAGAGASGASASTSTAPPAPVDGDAPSASGLGSLLGSGLGDDDDDDDDAVGGAGAFGLGGAIVPPAAAALLPRINVGMYAASASEDTSAAAETSLTYELPAGPAPMGPSAGAAEAAYGAVGGGGYGEIMPTDVDESQMVEVNADALLKAMGPAKQYDFMVPAPKQEVKIAASFWSRSSGEKETQYKASTLQKRKHQINSLAADAAVRSAEILAKGSKGLKSKKETAAKYGW